MQLQNATPNQNASDPLSKVSLSLFLSGATAYSVVVGMAYLWGYWAPFGVNILDYMGVADILTATAWPLLGVFSGMVVGIFIGGRGDPIEKAKKLKPNDRFGRALSWYWTHLRQVHYAILLFIVTLDTPEKWLWLSVLGGAPLTVYLMQIKWVEQIAAPAQLKLAVIFFVIAAPLIAISTGQRNSEKLMDGRVFSAVYSDVEGFPISINTKPVARLRLIGQRGDTLFMWDPLLKRIVVSKFPTGRPLVFGQIDTTAAETGWDAIVVQVKKLFN